MRGGWQWSPLIFTDGVSASMFDYMSGFAYTWGNNNMFGLTSPGGLTQPEERNTVNWNVDSTLSWLRGAHSLSYWEFSGAGRVQVRTFRAEGVRLVGMTEDELRDAFKIRIVEDPLSGSVTVFNMPQDIIDNTRRAFATDPTSATGCSADGPPTGRYLAPRSTPDCIAVFPGDCDTPRNLYVRGPIFTRFDLSLKKRFPIGRGASFDLQFDLLNAFDNVNFIPTFAPGEGATIFQSTSGYTDINTTFDPGGRIGQVIWRVNW